MFIVKCFKCKETLGAVINPASIPYIRCSHCGFDNLINLCIDKDGYYEDSREQDVVDRMNTNDAELRSTLFKQNVLV